MNKPLLTVIDLFAGAGGLGLGFSEKLGHSEFVKVWANDIDPHAVNTYTHNFGPHCQLGDLQDLLRDSSIRIPAADVVIGGPPCQGFSLLNKQRQQDQRRSLWIPFFEVVERSGAQVFVMENVPQLLDSPEYDAILAIARQLGFQVTAAKLCAADYGVAQVRWRAFIVGCRFLDPTIVFPPHPTHAQTVHAQLSLLEPLMDPCVSDRCYQPWRTVRDAIADLPPPVGTEIRADAPPLNLNFGRSPTPLSQKRYRTIPKEGMNRFDLQRLAPELTPQCWLRKTSGGTDLFGRLWWDRPSVTIRTEFFKPEKGRYLHPVQHRPITHREAARLQSFPDDFLFLGSKIEIAKQIGNAVPPLLAARIAGAIAQLFQTSTTPFFPPLQPGQALEIGSSILLEV